MPRVAKRSDGRKPGQLRPVSIVTGFLKNPPGSALVQFGNTRVLCSADISEDLPPWMRAQKVPGGWITAEYQMLPGSTSPRSKRENRSGPGGRAQEIQRLIGRSLRAAVDLQALGPRVISIDCDVLDADGGTRCASITGAMVALQMAVKRLISSGTLHEDPVRFNVAAVSAGLVDNTPMLDFSYDEDHRAQVDANIVMTENGQLIEVQASAEGTIFSRLQLDLMLNLAQNALPHIFKLQRNSLASQPS